MGIFIVIPLQGVCEREWLNSNEEIWFGKI